MYLRRLLVCLMLVIAAQLRAGEVLDSLVATVNGQAILESDWNEELRYECFISGRQLGELTREERRAAFQRLIDQELLREQMGYTGFIPATADEIASQLNQLKSQYAQEHNEGAWAAALLSYGLTENEVSRHVATELNELRVIDSRLRPSIQIDAAAINDYYQQEMVPKLPQGQQLSLKEATPKIREILTQQKINQALDAWLESLRSQARIHIMTPELPGVEVRQ
jgi:SurA N-terminal domain